MQRGLVALTACVDISPMLDQKSHNFIIPLERRHMQRRCKVLIARIDISLVLEKLLHNFDVRLG